MPLPCPWVGAAWRYSSAQSSRAGGPKQAGSRAQLRDAGMELSLTSCQLHAAWVGGSLGPCPALWPEEEPTPHFWFWAQLSR